MFLKKRIDYLSNKQNKYSIRRFTVGTTSVIVGATILFGIGNHHHKLVLVIINRFPIHKRLTNQVLEQEHCVV
ncbi:hypothetical protein SA19223_13080 [Staphylococcus argenteus]|nr:hypothetical protein SA19220_13070 [Staphylococcus argenteus]GJF77770.1 hypothetical protein SA19223_13080 [Staphylococcus argenteus]